MTYVPGRFAHDVAISYGHDDNATPTEGWVRALHEHVDGWLRQNLSRDVVVWRDPRLDNADLFRTAIQEAMEQAAVLVSILSPGFVGSEWCEKEASWFANAASRDTTVPGKSRLLQVEKNRLDDDTRLPPVLGDATLRVRFYDYDRQSAVASAYLSDRADPTFTKFRQAVTALAQSISDVLKRMRRAYERLPAQPETRAIFVAEVTRDVEEARDCVVAELRDRRFVVLQPTLRIGDGLDVLSAEIERSAASADVAVHTIGRTEGVRFGSDPLPIAQLRLMRAAAHAVARPLMQIVWVPEDDTARVEAVRHEITQALGGSDAEGGPTLEVIGGEASEFKDALMDIVNRTAREVPAAASPGSVFLLCNRRDLADPTLQAMRNWLLEQELPADVPVYEGDVSELTRLEEESIVEATATIIFYGEAPDGWVREKRRAVQKAWAKIRNAGRRARALYVADPASDLKQFQYLALPNRLLRESDGFSPLLIEGDCGPFDSAKLGRLLQAIGKAPAGT